MLEKSSVLVSPTLLLWAVGVLGLAFYVITSVVSYRRLSHFRGPVWAGVSQTWLFKQTLSGGLYLTLRDVSDKYGSLARIGPNMLLTDDPVLLRRINAARSPYTKGEWYDGVQLDPDIHNTISEKDEKRHNELRSKVANGYAGKDNPNLEAQIDTHILALISLLESSYISTPTSLKPLDFAHVAQYFTMDVLTEVAFSKPLGYLTSNSDLHGYIQTVRAYMPVLEMQTNIPIVNTILGSPWVRKIMAPTARDRFGMGKMMGVAKEVAAERFDDTEGSRKRVVKDDMLGSFVRHGMNKKQVESEALLQIMVGTDSTATAVRTIFYHILTTPRIYTRLQSELSAAYSQHRLSRPVIRDAESRSLPYLQACIQEGLRIWPPVASLIYKITPPEGDIYNDVRIPGGTRIGYSAWALHKSKQTFGGDAEIYRPERWLEAEGEILEQMKRSTELVFGYGKYGCLGKGIAFLELNKVFAELFLRFDFAPLDPQRGFVSRCNGMFMQSGMNVIVTPREI